MKGLVLEIGKQYCFPALYSIPLTSIEEMECGSNKELTY